MINKYGFTTVRQNHNIEWEWKWELLKKSDLLHLVATSKAKYLLI